MTIVVVGPDRQEWAAKIASSWTKSREGFIETGHQIISAKEKLSHGEFESMIESDLPFGPRTARRLMAIARDRRLSNRTHGSVLPPHWRTLYELTKLPDDEFDRRIADGTIHSEMQRRDATLARQANSAAGPHRTDRTGDLRALADSGQKFAAIYADPPWSFRVYSGKGKSRSAEEKYKTMSLAEIEGLGTIVDELSEKDTALFLWAVMPQLPEALGVIKAWGFEYKTCGFCWVKRTPTNKAFHTGMGYWTRANVEICLLATRGSPRRINKDVRQLVVEPRGRHSSKPETIAERISRLVPGPYLEMFARRERREWHVWGNDIEVSLLDER